MMTFTREEVSVIFQALCLAQRYYEDSNRVPPAGMVPLSDEHAKARLAGINPVIGNIMIFAESLLP